MMTREQKEMLGRSLVKLHGQAQNAHELELAEDLGAIKNHVLYGRAPRTPPISKKWRRFGRSV